MHLFLFVWGKETALVVTRLEDLSPEKLAPGFQIYDLGLASETLPPGRVLMDQIHLQSIFLDNVKPVIDIPLT